MRTGIIAIMLFLACSLSDNTLQYGVEGTAARADIEYLDFSGKTWAEINYKLPFFFQLENIEKGQEYRLKASKLGEYGELKIMVKINGEKFTKSTVDSCGTVELKGYIGF